MAASAIGHVAGRPIFTFKCAVERDRVAREVLVMHSPHSDLHLDILSWIHPDHRDRVRSAQVDRLRSVIFDESMQLLLEDANGAKFDFGDCHVAGPPCVDFSPMGAGRRELGPTMICLYVWARAVRDSRPMLLIIENVPRFPISLLQSLFGDIYHMDWALLEACSFGAPGRRRRLYVILTLKGKLKLSRSVSELVAAVDGHFVARRSWEILFCLPGSDDGFSKAVRRRSREYLRVFKDKLSIYDLDQLPRGRPRRARPGAPLFGLTAHTRNCWSHAFGRSLRRDELAASMGLPSHPALSSRYGMQHISFEGLSRSAAGRLIGNGMSVPCIGSILTWCAAHTIPDVVLIPAGLPITDTDPCLSRAVHGDLEESIPEGCSTLADHTVWTALGKLGRAQCVHSVFATLYEALRMPVAPVSRVRDLFPLPLIPKGLIADRLGLVGFAVEEASSYLDGVIVGLNWMYGFRLDVLALSSLPSTQRAAHEVILESGTAWERLGGKDKRWMATI